MKLNEKRPPRTYRCGAGEAVEIRDCGTVDLEPDEQLTFITPRGGQYDLTRKNWGYYATPSLNGRLPTYGLHPVLAVNGSGKWFVLLVEDGSESSCHAYLGEEGMKIVARLDDAVDLEAIARAFKERL